MRLIPGEFNGDQVSRHFNLSAQHTVERAAMHFMFRRMKQETGIDYASPARKYGEIAALTILHIESRFDQYNTMSGDFFIGGNIDHDALSLAVICGEYVNDLYEALPDKETGPIIEGPVRLFNNGIDDDIIDTAMSIHEEAKSLREHGRPPLDYYVTQEAHFLAHVQMIERLQEIEAEIEEVENPIDFLRREIPNARGFLRTDTQIGQILEKHLARAEADFAPGLYGSEGILARKRPSLSLVPRPESP